MSDADDRVSSLEAVLARARRAADVRELQQDRALRSQLKSLGLATHVDFLRVIFRSRDRTFFPADLDTLGIVARDRAFCRKLCGSGLDEAVLYLLARPALRARVTRRFLQELDQNSAQTHLVWHLADALEAALDRELISVRRFASMRSIFDLACAHRSSCTAKPTDIAPARISSSVRRATTSKNNRAVLSESRDRVTFCLLRCPRATSAPR